MAPFLFLLVCLLIGAFVKVYLVGKESSDVRKAEASGIVTEISSPSRGYFSIMLNRGERSIRLYKKHHELFKIGDSVYKSPQSMILEIYRDSGNGFEFVKEMNNDEFE